MFCFSNVIMSLNPRIDNLGGHFILSLSKTVHGGRLCHAGTGSRRSKSDLPECHVRRRRCSSFGFYEGMHEERSEGNEGRILSVQCGMGFQAHRVLAAGKVRTAFIFDAGNGRWR